MLVDLSRTIMGWGSDSEPYVGRVSASYSSGRRPGEVLERWGDPAAAGRGGDKLVKKRAYPPKKTDPIALALRVLSILSHFIPG